jgi:hypothetical protein
VKTGGYFFLVKWSIAIDYQWFVIFWVREGGMKEQFRTVLPDIEVVRIACCV